MQAWTTELNLNKQQKMKFEKQIMTKSFILLLTLFIVDISAIAQNNYAGKYYVAELSATCKAMTNGGCMVYKHCVLKFYKDSVEVSYPTKSICTPTEFEINYNSNNFNLTKKYKWMIVANKLVINDFTDYNKYSFQEKDSNFVKTLFQQAITYKNIYTDTLVYYKYIGGKPSTLVLYIERKVAKKWGIVMDYWTGNCDSNYDYKEKECEIKNKRLYEYLSRQFGENWKNKFDKEVIDEIKALSQTNNLNDSLNLKGIVKMENSDELLPYASIHLKNNKVETYSNVGGNFQLNVKNYKSLKFPDTLQINYAGLNPYKIAVNSIEELRTIFNLSNSFSLNQIQPIDTVQEGPHPIFTIKEPSDGYVQVVQAKKIKKKQKQVSKKNK
jgi:hypothetical protein